MGSGKKENTFKQFMMGLTVIHGAMLLGLLAFVAISLFLIGDGNSLGGRDPQLNENLLIAVPLISFACLLGSFYFSRNKIQATQHKDDLNQKLLDYRAALIIKLALIEGPTLLALISYLLTADYLYLGIASFLILVFLYVRPSKSRLINELELGDKERSQLNSPDFKVVG